MSLDISLAILDNRKQNLAIRKCRWFRYPANSPVELGSLSHDLLCFFLHPRWFSRRIFDPPTVRIQVPHFINLEQAVEMSYHLDHHT